MSAVTLDRPWLRVDLGTEMQVLSWAVNSPGVTRAREILWREVRNADLPRDLDVGVWLEVELARRGTPGALTLLTSRDIGTWTESCVTVEGTTARAVATVGLSNAERIGHRRGMGATFGTINVALWVDQGMAHAGLLELLSIATQARTAAVLSVELRCPSGPATGTGTDCLAVAAPDGNTRHAGLHTALGEAAGRAVYDAVARGARAWMSEQKGPKHDGS